LQQLLLSLVVDVDVVGMRKVKARVQQEKLLQPDAAVVVEMLVTDNVVEVTVVPFVRVPLVNEIVVLDVVIQGWPFQPQRTMLLVDHANDRHVDQDNMHP
jgi:hypothetical protein